MSILDRVRSNRGIRYGAQCVLVVTLLLLGYVAAQYEDEATEQEQTTQAVTAVFAASCDASTFAQLQAQGLLEECRLAQNGDLGDAIAEDAPEAQETPQADPLPDEPDTPPSEVQEISDSRLNEAAVRAVNAYFDAHPIPGPNEYQQGIRRAVAQFLSANPPEPGRPPNPAEIRAAVRDQLLANPPDAGPQGEPGDNGVGVANANLDGCDVVFTFTDGSTDRVGPLCGKDGEPGPPPTDADIAEHVAAYCDANGECRGPSGLVHVEDQCAPPAGEFVTDVATAYDEATSTLTITCTSSPGVLP